jgi:radical SAM superfamily enzyme
MLTMQDYITIVSKQLEFFSPETVIERLTGDGDKKKLVAPMWSANKIAVLGGIDKFQASSDSYQGKYFSEISHNKF